MPLEPWTYRTDNHTFPNYPDEGFHKLNDGVVGAQPEQTAIFRGGEIVLEVDLGGLARVTAVKAHVYRHNMNYKLRQMVVLADQAGQWAEVGRADGFWGPTEERAFTITAEGLNATTNRLQLRFLTAELLSISELEIEGERVAVDASSAPRWANLPLSDDPAPTAREVDADGDGKPDVVLENAFVRLLFFPATGGICRSFYLKQPGVELVSAPSDDYGLFRDQLWHPNYSFAGRFYFSRLDVQPDRASVELWASGAGGMLSFTEIRKRITLTRDSPVVRVHYELKNDPSSQTEYEYGLWFHHFLGVAGQTNTYFNPTVEGVQEFRFTPGQYDPRFSDLWYYEPARGWTAFASESGTGLAAEIEYKYLNCFYHWTGLSSLVATHEWRFNRLPLRAGETLATDLSLVPFHGLTRVDGVVADVVGGIEWGSNPPLGGLTAKLFVPPGVPPVEAQLRGRNLPDGAWRELAAGAASPGEVTALTAQWPGPAPGTYVVNCQLSRDGQILGDFERPMAVGGARLAYRLEPLQKRVGASGREEEGREPGHELSTEVVTPHVPWARPYAGGTLRGLILTDDMNAREVIELAQRLDLDFTYVKFRTTLDQEWLYQGDRSIRTLAQAQARLAGKLKERYDFFLFAGLKWDHHFTPELRQAILDQVRAGTGLVYVEPDGFTAEDMATVPGLGVATGRNMNGWHRWARAADHFLTDALPWDLFPRTRRMDYDPAPEGEVLATIGDDGAPLLVVSELGQGRVLALTYDVLTHDLSYRGYAALTPILSYRGGYLLDEFKALTHPYWEHWYALLCRACVWAARKETGVTVGGLEPLEVGAAELGREGEAPAEPLRMDLRAAALPADARVEITFRDKLGTLLAAPSLPAKPGPLTIPLPANLRAGLNLVDVIVRDGQGAALAWGAGFVRVTTPAALGEVTLANEVLLPRGGVWPPAGPVEARCWTPADPLTATVALEGTVATGDKLVASVVDNHGRLLATATEPMATGQAEAEVEFPLADLANGGLELRLELRRGEAVLDTARRRALALPPRVWERFSFTSWNGQYLWRSEYLFDFVADQVEQLGLDYAMNGDYELSTGKVWNDYWHGIGHTYLGLLSYIGPQHRDFGDPRFGEKSTHYAQTKDKADLVREPCLNDPQWRAEVRQAVQDRVRRVLAFGGSHDYCMGDEMSLTHYTRYHDYCWSEWCLAQFRDWLRARYGDLDTLNREWGSTFAAWDEVVPLTLDEARARLTGAEFPHFPTPHSPNAAPWADHRAFMDDTLADFFAFVQDSIREIDPAARCGLSGTQSPEAGNGMDWWKLSRAFSYYHSYNTSWSNEMRRSFQPATGVAQSPYHAGYWQSSRDLEYNVWWCLFHDTKGISAWTTPLFFYGDLTFSEAGRDTQKQMAEFRSGVWTLLRHARRQHDGIALHYSQPSVRAGALLGREQEVNAWRDTWVQLIEDLGLQYEFVASEQVEQGILREGFRVLILPASWALSPPEVAEIQRFVENGGTVLSGDRPGLFDERCRRPEAGLLDALFGVTVEEAAPAIPDGVRWGDLQEPVRLGVAEPGLRLATSPPSEGRDWRGGLLARGQAAAGNVPVVCVHEVGKGRAVLLNLNLTEFEQERQFHSPTERQVRELMASLLAEAGVRPPAVVTLESGQPPHVEMVRYRDGDLEYLGLLRVRSSADKEEVARLTLPQPRRVYNVREGRDLGETDTLTTPLAPGEARLYCLAPAALPAPRLEVLSAGRPGEPLTFRVSRASDGPVGAQVFRLTVRGPDGVERPDYAQNLLVTDAPLESHFRLALNDPPGTWSLAVRDVASGQETRVEAEVGK